MIHKYDCSTFQHLRRGHYIWWAKDLRQDRQYLHLYMDMFLYIYKNCQTLFKNKPPKRLDILETKNFRWKDLQP